MQRKSVTLQRRYEITAEFTSSRDGDIIINRNEMKKSQGGFSFIQKATF